MKEGKRFWFWFWVLILSWPILSWFLCDDYAAKHYKKENNSIRPIQYQTYALERRRSHTFS